MGRESTARPLGGGWGHPNLQAVVGELKAKPWTPGSPSAIREIFAKEFCSDVPDVTRIAAHTAGEVRL